MIKSSIEKLAETIGFDIAHSDNKVQSDLLNGLFDGIYNSMDSYKVDTQLCYIVDGISAKTSNAIKKLAEFIELKESNN